MTSPFLDSCYCFAVRQAARRITSAYDAALAPTGVTSPQFGILSLLDETPGASLQDLALALRADRTTVLRGVQVLEKAGLIAALPRLKAKAELKLHLTKAGMDRLTAARPLWSGAQRQFEADCSVEKAGHLRAALLALSPRI